MSSDLEKLLLLQKQVVELQEWVLELARNQKLLIQAGVFTNNAVKRLAEKVEGSCADEEVFFTRTVQ